MQTASREQKRLFDFSMRVTIKRPQDVDAAAAAASAAVPGAAASAAVAAKKP